MFSINDKVVHENFGVGRVADIRDNHYEYPMVIEFKSCNHSFTLDGKYNLVDDLPSLYLLLDTREKVNIVEVTPINFTNHINSWGIFRDNPNVQGGVLGRLRDYIKGSDAPFMSEYTQWAHFTPLTGAQIAILGLEP